MIHSLVVLLRMYNRNHIEYVGTTFIHFVPLMESAFSGK
jgi:hypothetical protein